MKELLAKIREAKPEEKCRLVAEVYEQLEDSIAAVEKRLEGITLEKIGEYVDKFHTDLDELDGVCSELLGLLNPELQKMLRFLQPRFEQNMHRHKNLTWKQVEQRLREADPKKLWSLNEMEKTGGEPDVVGADKKTGQLVFQDRSPETPTGRRNCVYDREAEQQLKRVDPNDIYSGNAIDLAAVMSVELLSVKEYRAAQAVDRLDQNSWSWLKTPVDKRRKGVALSGYRDEVGVDVSEDGPNIHVDFRGWRGQIKI